MTRYPIYLRAAHDGATAKHLSKITNSIGGTGDSVDADNTTYSQYNIWNVSLQQQPKENKGDMRE